LQIPRNTLKIVEMIWKLLEMVWKFVEMLWKCLEIICDFIFHFFAAMAQQEMSPFP
jgi:predicted DCC family thiol-disulfide oxidoreductase YuxK